MGSKLYYGDTFLGEVVNLRSGEPYDIYIGRSGHGMEGYFGNPVAYRQVCPVCEDVHTRKGSTLPCFDRYATSRAVSDPTYRARVKELLGKKLACFCSPSPCHGEVLLRLAFALRVEDGICSLT